MFSQKSYLTVVPCTASALLYLRFLCIRHSTLLTKALRYWVVRSFVRTDLVNTISHERLEQS